MYKALFLDRDGVVNKEVGYLHRIEDFQFIEGIVELCQWAQLNEYLIIIVTNQAGIARGMYSEDDFVLLTQHIKKQFDSCGVRIADTFHCPHHPDGSVKALAMVCSCRKPKPGMLLRAIEKYDLNPSNSIFVGDKVTDVRAGKKANIGLCVLVGTGHQIDLNEKHEADVYADDLIRLCSVLAARERSN